MKYSYEFENSVTGEYFILVAYPECLDEICTRNGWDTPEWIIHKGIPEDDD